ncbi:hypothetical protein PF008_g8825 [Phytophthora fragariae]|uniref:Uncharacterized protein n=1 Tax=Phytophthora fragariae TaxID=53985 RepID=A0A6G0RYG3_9STRA|nr:hypothetical protein PF008_g8825 [Phytophthora fragariae]
MKLRLVLRRVVVRHRINTYDSKTCIVCKMCVVNKNCNYNMKVVDGATLRLRRMLCVIIKIEIGTEARKDYCMSHDMHKVDHEGVNRMRGITTMVLVVRIENNLTTVDTCVRRPTTSSNVDTRAGLSPHAVF